MFLILFLYMVLASTFTFGKAALSYVAPFLLIGIRMVLAGTILLGYQYLFDGSRWRIEKKHFWLFFQLALFHIYFAYTLEFWAMQYVSSFKASFLFNLSPFITAFFAYIMFAERLTKKKIMGLIVGIIGFLPMLMASAPAERVGGSIFFLSMPELMLLCAVTSAAYGWPVLQRAVRDEHYTPIMANGIAMLFGGLLALGTSFIVEGFPALLVPSDMAANTAMSTIALKASFHIVAMILTANIVFYNMYGWLLKRYSATFLSFAGFTCPLFAALFGWFFLGETITWHFFCSVAIVVLGLYIFYQDELVG